MENKYFLAVETKPKNYFPINLLNLKIANNYSTNKLEELDAFTLKFNKKEIINAIKDANIIEVNDNMPLIVIYNEKNVVRKINVLTKDINFDMWKNIKDNYDNKVYLNKIYNFLSKKVEEEILFQLKNSKDIKEFLNNINNLPYLIQRKLYFYLYEK